MLFLSFMGEGWGLRGRVSIFIYWFDDIGKILVLFVVGMDLVVWWIYIFL